MKILIISQYIPHFKSGHGTGVFLYDFIKYLSKTNEITLISFCDDSEIKFVEDLSKLPIKIYPILRPRGYKGKIIKNIKLMIRRLIQFSIGIIYNEPLIVSKYRNIKMKNFIKVLFKNEKFDLVQIESLPLAQYVKYIKNNKTVLHEHDVVYRPISRKQKQTKSLIKKFFISIEKCRIYYYEKNIIKHFNLIFTVTEQDKLLLERMTRKNNIVYLPRGIELPPEIIGIPEREKNTLLFIGSFNHKPNVDAIEWFIKKIYPEILINYPNTKFIIIGPNPPKWMIDISKNNQNILVTGFVEDIGLYLRKCSIFVAPLWQGGGIKIKILTAMAYGLPVVTTRIGAEGIEGLSEQNILIANTEEQFIERISLLLDNTDLAHKIGLNAKVLIKNYYSWEKVIKYTEKIYSSLF